MSLRILIDLQAVQNESRHRGIGRYSMGLSKAIVRNAGNHKVFVLLNGLFPETVDEVRMAFSGMLEEDRFLVFDAPGPVDEGRSENTWRRRTAEVLREYCLDSLAPDAVLVPSMVEGSLDNTVTSVGHIRSRVPTAAILHDLIPLTDLDRYVGTGIFRTWYLGKVEALRRADLLFAVSQSAANEAIRLLRADPARVQVISAAAEECFSATAVSAAQLSTVTKRLGISRKYLMHSSAFDPRKNFQGLIRAYAELPAAIRKGYQLVLVCKLDAAGRDELSGLIRDLGLEPGDVVLPGFIPDSDLIALYAGCHLFVFPSFHEGFGLPALEAMSCGAPTIGSNATSVPEVIGRDDALFDPASVQEMTAVIHKALTSGVFYRSLKAHAKAQAAKFSWDRTARRAIEGLEQLVKERRVRAEPVESAATRHRNMLWAVAGIAKDTQPNDADIVALARSIERNHNAVNRVKGSAAFSGSLNWRLEGPFDSTYSLALVNRETARALTALGHNVILHSTEGPGDFEPNAQFLTMNPELDVMHRRVEQFPHRAVDVVSRNLYPPRVEDMNGARNLLHHYPWEESGFPPTWVGNFNGHLDGITCSSTHVEKVLLDNGVCVPIVTSGNGVDHWERIVASRTYTLKARAFRFLHVSSCFPRKGVDVLLAAYGRVFTDADDVSLVIKTFPNPHNEVQVLLAQHRSRAPNYPHVTIMEGELAEPELKALYQQCHVLVAPSRAEGFGLPIAEAVLSGMQVITTAWSGQLDFCTADNAWLVDFSFERAQTHFGIFNSVWANPDCAALAEALLKAYNVPLSEFRTRTLAARKLLLDNFKWIDVAAKLVAFAAPGDAITAQPSLPRIGWITTWNSRCGIASYSKHLTATFPQEVTILAPHTERTVSEDGPSCLRSWSLGKENNELDKLEELIGVRGLDILVIQFNYGFFNFRELGRFIGAQVDAGRAVVMMMHSTVDPGKSPAWNYSMAELVPALARCHRVLVHSTDDLNRLKFLGLVRNVSLFPHGVLDVKSSGVAQVGRALPLVATYGYCLPHKGLIELIKATGMLRQAGTPIRLRLVNAEYPAGESSNLIREIRDTVANLELCDLVEMHNDYLEDEQSQRLLQDADLIVYPYQRTNESASGAVRFGLAVQRPVAVTPIPIFKDLGDAVHRLPGTDPSHLAIGIAAVLRAISNRTQAANSVEREAELWRRAHSYGQLGARLYSLCKALARDVPTAAWILDGSSMQLRTEVGRIVGRSIVSAGAAGYLVFGPYLPIPAGRYRVVVRGSYRLVPESAAHCDVCIDGGSTVLGHVGLRGSADSAAAELEILLPRRCQDLEVRVAIDDSDEFRIDLIEIRRVETTGISEDAKAGGSLALGTGMEVAA